MTNRATRPRKRDGTLRDGLIEVGITLLREKGPDGLSLRECAARAGVSHAAPTYHFKNLKGLSTAIAARAFCLFAQSMETSIADAADTPSARLAAICEGYLAFARGDHGEESAPTDVEALLREIADELRVAGHEITVNFSGDPTVKVRPQGFKRCLTNPIKNALRHGKRAIARPRPVPLSSMLRAASPR